MVKHANPKLQAKLDELNEGYKWFVALDIPPVGCGEYEIYIPSFALDFSVRSSLSNRCPRFVGKGDFDIKNLAFTEATTKDQQFTKFTLADQEE